MTSFSSKLEILLKNKNFREIVDNFDKEEDDEFTFNTFKEELEKTKLKNRKNNIENKINEKRKIDQNQKDFINKKRKEKETVLVKKDDNNNTELNDTSLEESSIEETHPYIFFYTDKDNRVYNYTFHQSMKEYYNLRCSDRNCKGTAKYNVLTAKIEVNNKCTIDYEKHSYKKEKIIIDKIKNEDLTKEEIENDINYQEIFFKYIYSTQPNLHYYDIALLLKEKYNIEKITYSLSQFNNYKKRFVKTIKYNDNREEIIDSIELNKEKLMKFKIEYLNENNTTNTIRIYATNDSIKLLNDKNISQYFIDGTYKCVPHSINSINVLILLIGYNTSNQRFEMASIITLNAEDYENYKHLYLFLKSNYNFIPKIITFDFCIANIKALKEIYEHENVTFIPCFFHFVQCLWRKASNLGLRKKLNIHRTRILMLNMKLLPFLEKNKAREFYKLIKEEFSEEKYEAFYDYFENTWLNIDDNNKTKFDYELWSYCGKFDFENSRKEIISNSVLEKYVFLSNNACESINNLIHNYIAINNKVSIDRFETIIKILFVRLNCVKNNKHQLSERLENKQLLSDVLLEIINAKFAQNLFVLSEYQYNKLKRKPNETEIFQIINNNYENSLTDDD